MKKSVVPAATFAWLFFPGCGPAEPAHLSAPTATASTLTAPAVAAPAVTVPGTPAPPPPTPVVAIKAEAAAPPAIAISPAPAVAEVSSGIASPQLSMRDRLVAWRLRPEDIGDELTRTGRVARVKSPAATAVVPTDSDTLASLVSAKLQGDSDFALLQIRVEASSGAITLHASTAAPDQVGRALALTLDTEGVTQAVFLTKATSP